MFRILNRNKKGQNTAEYALLISLVVAAIIAMQTYAQRSLQARIRDAGQYLKSGTSALGTTDQYEPYYLQTQYNVTRNSVENVRLDNSNQGTNMDSSTNRTRGIGGFQKSNYTGIATP